MLLFAVRSSLRFCLLLMMLWLGSGCISESPNRPQQNSKGHRYTYHRVGNGQQALPGEHILYHVYQRADDSLINNSRHRPVQPRLVVPDTAQARQLRNPINEALLRMSVGDSLTISIPMTEVPQRPPEFANYQFLHFDVVVTAIQSAEVFQQEQERSRIQQTTRRQANQARKAGIHQQLLQTIQQFHAGTTSASWVAKPSGLQYQLHHKGSGTIPGKGEIIDTYFYSVSLDGTPLSSTFDQADAYRFLLGEGTVIPAWEEVCAELPRGSQFTLFVPPHLAYGKNTDIRDVSISDTLVYYIEILE